MIRNGAKPRTPQKKVPSRKIGEVKEQEERKYPIPPPLQLFSLLSHTSIWEKKYGGNANHKKKERVEKGSSGLHHRRDVSGINRQTSRTKSDDRFRRNHAGHPEGPVDTTQSMIYPANKEGEKPLHPSWEAKKKLKEKQSFGILPAQGKKIRF
jgi:BUD22